MLDLRRRWIQFHELHLKSEPAHADLIPLQQIAPLLVARIKAQESVKLLNHETAAIRITDSRTYQKDKCLVLLIQYADQDVTPPVFSDLKTGELREEPLLEGEGVAVSGHVALSLEPRIPESPFYKLLLEDVPGLGRSQIQPFLKSEMKSCSKGRFTFRDETATGNRREKPCRPAALIEPTASVTLREDLRNSEVKEVELIRYEKEKKSFDEEGFFRERVATLKLDVISDENILERLARVRKQAQDAGYSDLRIRYKGSFGKQKTALIGTSKADVADSLVARTEVITADEILAQCSPKIVRSIADQMVQFIVDDRK